MFPRMSQGHPASLGNLCHCFTTLIVINFFLYLVWNSFISKLFPLVLLLQALLKGLSPFCNPPLGIKGHGKVSLKPSFLQAEPSQLSVCLHGRGVPAVSSFLASPGLYSRSIFSCWGPHLSGAEGQNPLPPSQDSLSPSF